MNATPKWWPHESAQHELVDGAWTFVGLLRKAGIEPDRRLLDWITRAEIRRVFW